MASLGSVQDMWIKSGVKGVGAYEVSWRKDEYDDDWQKMSGDFSECVVHQEPWRQSFKKGM